MLTKVKPAGRRTTISIISSFIVLSLFVPTTALCEEPQSIDTLKALGRAFSTIAEKASPAVVAIKVKKSETVEYPSFETRPFDPFSEDFFDYFFHRRTPQQQPRQRQKREIVRTGLGSGFIVSPDGYILTNNHLVEDIDEVQVTLTNGKEYKAKIVGTDPDSDVAVIKINAKDLPYLELADSDKIEVGEWVLAIGNPFGLSHTVTAGIISAKGRKGFGIAEFEDFIQTDAAINHGNSGGPLINLDGKVIGINTALIGPGANIGIGLAIPVNIAKSSYEQIITKGSVTRGYLGVSITDLTPELAEKFGIKDKDLKGALVPEIMLNSPADKAGIQPGDIIVELDGQTVEKTSDLQKKIAAKEPGTKVEVVVIRDGKRKTLKATLERRPDRKELEAKKTSAGAAVEKLGIVVQNLNEEAAKRYGYEDQKGVLVTEVADDSLAATAGIEPGSLIQEVNRQPVEDVKQFNEEINSALQQGKVSLLIRSQNRTSLVVIEMPEE
jgi:serine protease Do